MNTQNAGSGALAVTVDGPSKVQLHCCEVEEGYEFTYTPSAPGDYLITIKYAGNSHVPGSPFKARIVGKGTSQCVLSVVVGIHIVGKGTSQCVLSIVVGIHIVGKGTSLL